MRALVTGASGFIGAHLCRRMQASGWDVHRVSRSPAVAGSGRAWQLDLTDAAATADTLAAVRPQVVVHLAARVTGRRDAALVVPVFADTAVATVHVLAAAYAAGTPRVVLAGSMEEPDAAAPHSPYAAAKQAAAVYGHLYRALYALEVVHLRIHMVYGPGQRDERKLIPSVLSSLAAGQPPAVSSGARRVDWVHVDDVCEAVLAAATVQPAPTGPVDVGTGVATSLREVVERLVQLSGADVEPVFGAVPDRPLEVEPVADTDAAAAALNGWRATLDLTEGLRRTLAAGHS